MSRKQKKSAEEKVKIIRQYQQGEISISQAAELGEVDFETAKDWIRNYESEGVSAFLPHKNKAYSPEKKYRAVESYLSGEGSLSEMDYPEAVQLMLSMGVGTVQGAVEPFSRPLLELPPKHENMRRVYGYLIRRRGIDKDVLDAFAYRGLVYESADYHNAVFVGTGREGKPRHIHKRSTAAQGGFKGNAPGSEPEYSFHWNGGGDTLFLFEAPIDMLSFITLHKQSWKSYCFAAACGVSDRVLWQTLKDRPYITKVCICLDNDEPGQKAARRISKALADKNICNKILVPTRKDWNEDLLFLRKEGAE